MAGLPGFGPSFVNTLLAGQALMSRRQEMEERKKELDLRTKLFDLEAKKLQASLEGQRSFRDAVLGQPASAGDLEGGASPGVPGVPLPEGMEGFRGAIAAMGPEKGGSLLMEGAKQGARQDPFKLLQRLGVVPPDQQVPAAPQGGQEATTAPGTAPQGLQMPAQASQQAAAGPAGPQRDMAPQPGQMQFQGFSVDQNGGFNFQFGPVKYDVKTATVEVAPGKFQQVQIWADPQRPGNRHMVLMGRPQPTEMIERFGLAAQSWGLQPGTDAHAAAVADIAAAMSFEGDAQNVALTRAQAKWMAVAKSGQQPAAGTQAGGSVVDEVTSLRSERVDKETRAREKAQREESPLQGTDRAKFQALESALRSSELAMQNYKPTFVGKGFQMFTQEYQKQADLASKGQYAGGLAGGLREFFGNISGEEVTFRRSLVDAADILLRARSGAQINESEFSRLSKMLGQVTDEPKVFEPAMKRFIGEIRAQMKSVRDTAVTPARDLKVPDAAPAAPAAPAPAPAAPRALSAPKAGEDWTSLARRYARERYGKAFHQLTSEQQGELIDAARAAFKGAQ